MQMWDPDQPLQQAQESHSTLALEISSFNWNAKDRYTELLHFGTQVMNIIETKAYELTNEENLPLIKNWLDREGIQILLLFL